MAEKVYVITDAHGRCDCPCNSCDPNGIGPHAGTHVGPGMLDRYYDDHQKLCNY